MNKRQVNQSNILIIYINLYIIKINMQIRKYIKVIKYI